MQMSNLPMIGKNDEDSEIINAIYFRVYSSSIKCAKINSKIQTEQNVCDVFNIIPDK